MTYDYTDLENDLQEDALQAMFREQLPLAINDLSDEVARKYFHAYGDAVQERIDRTLTDAKMLAKENHHEAAMVRAFTAIELIVSYLLFRPVFAALLLSDVLADKIVEEIFDGRGDRERQLLPTVLKHYGVDLEKITFLDGRPLWTTITGQDKSSVRLRRNKVVHSGRSATSQDASDAIQGAELLLERVVQPLGKQLGFKLETGKWSPNREGKNPFKD